MDQVILTATNAGIEAMSLTESPQTASSQWSIPVLLLLSMALGLLLAFLGHATLSAWLSALPTTNDSFLYDEPLQIHDIKVSLNTAMVAAQRGEWRTAMRLVRDSRNQWEDFQPEAPHSYGDRFPEPTNWQRYRTLWDKAVQRAEQEALAKTLQLLQQLVSGMNRYRFRYITL